METDIEFIDQAPAKTETENTSSNAGGGHTKKRRNILPIIAIVLLIIIIIIIPLILKKNSTKSESLSKTTPTPTNTQSTSPTLTPTPEISKKEIKVSIKNGTGIPREASFLKDKLTALGYEDVETGNADKDTYESTIVSFSNRFPSIYKDELIKELDKDYDQVDESAEDITKGNFDIEIITGTRPGVSKPTPKVATPSATIKPSSTTTPTVTNTNTPTPTH